MSYADTPLVSHDTLIRVTYRDTDQMGIVYYGNYPTWFEIGRTELLRATGITYRDWEIHHGIFLPVVQCHLDYHHPAHYDDMLNIQTSITTLTKASVIFQYRLTLVETGRLLVTGYTKHPFVNREGKIARIAHQILPHWFSILNGTSK